MKTNREKLSEVLEKRGYKNEDLINEIEQIYNKQQLPIHGVINWLPFVRENYPEFEKLTREKNCLCLYDDGTEIDFEKENHPIAILTHFKSKS